MVYRIQIFIKVSISLYIGDNMKDEIKQKVIRHGDILRNAFRVYEYDPIKLCQALRRLEVHASRLNEMDANGEGNPERNDAARNLILEKVNSLLNNESLKVPIFINTDPRGYALKIDDEFLRKVDKDSVFFNIPRDWGGYGLIAPDLRED